MQVSVVQKDQWQDSWQMHRCYAQVFHGERSLKDERPDFALVCTEDEKLRAFVTCIELDSETLYWQHGGAFDQIKNSLKVKRALLACLAESKSLGFKRVRTMIENTNTQALKLEMHCGFLISGTYFLKGKLFVELVNELGG